MLTPAISKKSEAKKIDGEVVFKQHCASCHADGGNSIKPNHPVAEAKELGTLATFKNYLSKPPGHMPYYKNVVDDKGTLEALYKYCKTLKKPKHQQAFEKTPKTAS
jgi:mono/diheme cytochrome c family protein